MKKYWQHNFWKKISWQSLEWKLKFLVKVWNFLLCASLLLWCFLELAFSLIILFQTKAVAAISQTCFILLPQTYALHDLVFGRYVENFKWTKTNCAFSIIIHPNLITWSMNHFLHTWQNTKTISKLIFHFWMINANFRDCYLFNY